MSIQSSIIASDDTDEDLVAYYLDWTENALSDLTDLVAKMKTESGSSQADRIYEISHNIKGMGSSFGFPLMTQAGTSLCVYLRRLEGADPAISVLDAHLKSFQLIIAKRITGSGGEMGEELVGRLNQLVEHILPA